MDTNKGFSDGGGIVGGVLFGAFVVILAASDNPGGVIAGVLLLAGFYGLVWLISWHWAIDFVEAGFALILGSTLIYALAYWGWRLFTAILTQAGA